MSERLKYIVVERYGVECAIVFNSILGHNEICSGRNVIAAGNCVIVSPHDAKGWGTVTCSDAMEVYAGGESTTLKIHSRPEDAALILATLKRALD